MANPKPIHPSVRDGLVYEARLRRLVLRPLFRNLRAGLSQASAAAQLLAELHGGAFQSTVSNDLIAGEVGAFMRGLSLKHKRMLIRSFQTALAIDITGVLGEAPIQTWMAARIKENVALIKTIGPAAHAGLAKRLTHLLQTTPFDEAKSSDILRQAVRRQRLPATAPEPGPDLEGYRPVDADTPAAGRGGVLSVAICKGRENATHPRHV